MTRIPESEWIWYGFGGHFVCRDRCGYHLCTRIGGYLISTIGHFVRDWHKDSNVTPLRCEPDSFYETMVFTCYGEDDDGNPNITDHNPIAEECYVKSIDAERGHRAYCERYASRPETR